MPPEYRLHDVVWTPERVARFWSALAGQKAAEASYFGAQAGVALIRYVSRTIRLEGAEILDYGCGNGAILEALLDRGLRGRGLEFSSESAARCEARLRGRIGFGGVVTSTALPTPLAPASADVVLCTEVVEHLLDGSLEATLRELHRLVRPGGHVVVTTPNDEDLEARKMHCPECGAGFHPWQHVRSFDARTLRAALEGAGFRTVQVEAIDLAVYGEPRRAWFPLARQIARRATFRPVQTPNLIYIGRR